MTEDTIICTTEAEAEECIAQEHYYKLGKKTSACLLTLKNGVEVVGLSACGDPKDFDHVVGEKISRRKALDQVIAYLAFRKHHVLAIETARKVTKEALGAMGLDVEFGGQDGATGLSPAPEGSYQSTTSDAEIALRNASNALYGDSTIKPSEELTAASSGQIEPIIGVTNGIAATAATEDNVDESSNPL